MSNYTLSNYRRGCTTLVFLIGLVSKCEHMCSMFLSMLRCCTRIARCVCVLILKTILPNWAVSLPRWTGPAWGCSGSFGIAARSPWLRGKAIWCFLEAHACTLASLMLSHDGRRQRDLHGNHRTCSWVVGKQLWLVAAAGLRLKQQVGLSVWFRCHFLIRQTLSLSTSKSASG